MPAGGKDRAPGSGCRGREFSALVVGIFPQLLQTGFVKWCCITHLSSSRVLQGIIPKIYADAGEGGMHGSEHCDPNAVVNR